VAADARRLVCARGGARDVLNSECAPAPTEPFGGAPERG
jgi:hypothetical protein